MRTAMAETLEELGIDVDAHHHEVASGGQGEIGMRFDSLLPMVSFRLRRRRRLASAFAFLSSSRLCFS